MTSAFFSNGRHEPVDTELLENKKKVATAVVKVQYGIVCVAVWLVVVGLVCFLLFWMSPRFFA